MASQKCLQYMLLRQRLLQQLQQRRLGKEFRLPDELQQEAETAEPSLNVIGSWMEDEEEVTPENDSLNGAI